ncbi:MAG TPA: hypothetical protein VIJ25_21420 [Methylococcales bacterium]
MTNIKYYLKGKHYETSIRKKRLLSSLNAGPVGIGWRLFDAAGSIVVRTAGAAILSR